VNVENATMARLAQIANIVGVKEASGSISQMASLLAIVPPDFVVLSGDDGITLPLISLGGRGVISVASNEIPAPMTQIAKLALANDFEAARALHNRWFPLMEVNFVETNPIPVKSALALMGLCEPVFRLPMVPPKAENLAKIRGVLESSGLLSQRIHVAS
jgi:4-hydroxy-tetrahydrodipicolinate synthase